MKKLFKIINNYIKLSNADFDDARDEITKSNNRMAIFILVLSSILDLLLLTNSLIDKTYKSYISLYLIFLLAFILLIFIFTTKIVKKYQVSRFLSYTTMSILMLVGFALSYLIPEERAVSFFVLLIINSMLFIDKPKRISIYNFIVCILFIIMTLKIKSGNVRKDDIVNTFCYGLASFLCCHVIMRIKIENIVMSKELITLSKIDKLTSLNNRNSFELNVASIGKENMFEGAIAYIDANGLHNLNNTLGHSAGDEMLKGVASTLKKYFEYESIFRTGGDEFILILPKKDEEFLKKTLEKVKEEILSRNYSISIGYAISTGNKSFNMILDEAEKLMYKDKKEYYAHTLNDRRTSL